MKTIVILTVIFMMTSMAFALTVGKRTGFDYGIIVGGHTGLSGSGSTPVIGDWILDTNFWVDTGVWKDTSTWND